MTRSRTEDGATAAVASPTWLNHVDELIADRRAQGLAISVHTSARLPELPPAAEAAACRVVHEALSNIARHAPGAAAQVSLLWTCSSLDIIVDDDGGPGGPPKAVAGPGHGPGRGLADLRDRLSHAGGQLLRAGPQGSGYRLYAVLPAEPKTGGTPDETPGDREPAKLPVRLPALTVPV